MGSMMYLVHGAKIQTYDLLSVSLLPLPLDQGSRLKFYFFI